MEIVTLLLISKNIFYEQTIIFAEQENARQVSQNFTKVVIQFLMFNQTSVCSYFQYQFEKKNNHKLISETYIKNVTKEILSFPLDYVIGSKWIYLKSLNLVKLLGFI